MVRQFVEDHGSISPHECRQLLGLGESQTARIQISRYFKKWSKPDGFLWKEGKTRSVRYHLRSDEIQKVPEQ
jgi:ATP-dependent DNA helicase RecG